MPMNSISDLFYDTLRDVYWAEKHLLKALPKMIKKTSNSDLAAALEDHRLETEGQVDRLEKVFVIIDKAARAKTCEAMVGLSAEADHVLEEADDATVRDVGIIAAAQAVEHYEIARYGTLVAWATCLGHDEAAELLAETLEEEKTADESLSALAESINREAEAGEQAEAA